MSRRTLPSLRTELLATIAILAAAALAIAVGSVMLFGGLMDSRLAGVWLTLLIFADVSVFVAFGAYQLRRLVLRPLGEIIAATEAISGGDLARRAPAGGTVELQALATSINRLTDHLLEEQVSRTRAEKLATVGRLAAGIAHEIGNPLGAINGYTHILRTRVGAEPSAREALDALDRESGRIDRIVRGLLDYARPRRATPTGVDLNDVVRSAVRLLEDQGVLRRVTLHVALDEREPRLMGERHELEQALVNLLLNAVDAAGPEGTLTVSTRCLPVSALREGSERREGDAGVVAPGRGGSERVRAWLERAELEGEVASLIVADSGPGVSEEEAERVFDPFYTTKEPGRGTGLGLAIVARIVEAFGGTIWVRRAREGGAAFVMLLPVAPRRGGLPPSSGTPVRGAVAVGA